MDFIPHRRSINGTDSNNTAIRLGHAPVREAIADKIQAMNNMTNSNLLVTEKHLTKTIKDFENIPLTNKKIQRLSLLQS